LSISSYKFTENSPDVWPHDARLTNTIAVGCPAVYFDCYICTYINTEISEILLLTKQCTVKKSHTSGSETSKNIQSEVDIV